MGLINSNIFNLDIGNLALEDSSEIVSSLDKKIDIVKTLKDISTSLSEEAYSARNKLEIKPLMKKDIIELDKSNFSQYQYSLLKDKYIGLYEEAGRYIFLTLAGELYSIQDETLISIIMSTPRPRKIVYNSPCDTDSTYSMKLMANLMENIKTNSISELLKYYNFKFDNIFDALNILVHIFSIYEKIIYKYDLNHYINYEHKVYKIFNSLPDKLNSNENEINIKIDDCNQRIENLREKLEINSDFITMTPDKALLSIISEYLDNPNICLSLNPRFIKTLNLPEYNKLINLYWELSFLSNSLPDTYNLGLIKPYIILHNNSISITAKYSNLFQNIFAEVSNNKDYIQIVNDNKNLFLEKLSPERNIDDNLLLLIEYSIEAYMNKCSTVEEYKLYFYKNKFIILSDDDIELLMDILSTDLKEFIVCIDSFDNSIQTFKFIIHEDVKNFAKMYYKLKRKLIKDLIIEVNEYIDAFNNQNKAKIYLCGYFNDGIYIKCDENSYENALDTLTRTLVKTYDKCLKKTKSFCYIENLDMNNNANRKEHLE